MTDDRGSLLVYGVLLALLIAVCANAYWLLSNNRRTAQHLFTWPEGQTPPPEGVFVEQFECHDDRMLELKAYNVVFGEPSFDPIKVLYSFTPQPCSWDSGTIYLAEIVVTPEETHICGANEFLEFLDTGQLSIPIDKDHVNYLREFADDLAGLSEQGNYGLHNSQSILLLGSREENRAVILGIQNPYMIRHTEPRLDKILEELVRHEDDCAVTQRRDYLGGVGHLWKPLEED